MKMRSQVLTSFFVVGLALASSASADMIGMNFAGPGENGAVTGSNIGVTGRYQQSNWNNKFTEASPEGVETTYYGFVDSNGKSLGTDASGFHASLWNYGACGIDTNVVPGIVTPPDSGPRNGDNQALGGSLFTGFMVNASSTHEAATSLHMFNIPYKKFDIVLYLGNTDTALDVRTYVGATQWNIAGTPQDGTFTNQGIMKGNGYTNYWQESSHDGSTGGNYFVIKDLTTLNNDGHLDLQLYRGASSGWGVVFAAQIVSVPEPGTLTLLVAGLLGLLCYAWRKRK
jgi:hypothetical protein